MKILLLLLLTALQLPQPAGRPRWLTETTIPPGPGLQAALNAAPAGARIVLQPGVYTGELRVTKAVTLTTAGWSVPDGQRVSLSHTPQMAQLLVGDTPGVNVGVDVTGSNVTIRGVRITGAKPDLVQCGRGDSSQTTLAQVPQNVVFDQVIIEGDPVRGTKRALGLHCAHGTLSNSYVHQVRWTTDSSAIGGWNGPGPFTLRNNFISGGSETILFGGADPAITGLVSADILVERNTLTFPLEWRGVVSRKNAFELKQGRRVTVQDNTIENSWTSGQTGYCVVFTPSQYGTNPGVIIEDLVFQRNEVRHCGGFANILGHGQNQSTRPTQVSRRLMFRDNWIHDIDKALGDHGGLMQVGNGPSFLSWIHNTVEVNGDAFIRKSDSIPMPEFQFSRNLVLVGGKYGLFMAGASRGASLAIHLPDAVISDNMLVAVHPTVRTNLPANHYVAVCDWQTACSIPSGLISSGRGIGIAEGFGRLQ